MSYPHWPDLSLPILGPTHMGTNPYWARPILGPTHIGSPRAIKSYEMALRLKTTINVYLKGGACSQAKPKMHPMLMVNAVILFS